MVLQIMKISVHLYEWLQSKKIYELSPLAEGASPAIPSSILDSLADGPGFGVLLSSISKSPLLSKLKAVNSVSDRLSNWNLISEVLKKMGIRIDNDAKSLLVAGDHSPMEQLLLKLRDLESKTSNKEGVLIETIHPEKSLAFAENCLEFLILSICQSFNLTPKQAAGLLTQSYKYLAHISAKGLKSDFKPVVSWFQEVHSHLEHLAKLVNSEEKSVNFVLEAFKPGLISSNIEVVHWCLKTLTEFCSICHNKMNEIWNWFEKSEVLSMGIYAIQRFNVLDIFVEFLVQISHGHCFQLFAELLLGQFKTTHEYLEIVNQSIPILSKHEKTVNELKDSKTTEFFVRKTIEHEEERGFRILFLKNLAIHIGFNEKEFNMISSYFHKACRDNSFPSSALAIGILFELLDSLSELKSNFAPILYRSAVFLLIENYSNLEKREFILNNMMMTLKKVPSIPIGVIIEPLVKCLSTEEINCSDIDFFIFLAQHPRLSLKNSIQFIDAMGTLYINNIAFARAIGSPFTHLASRFVECEAMQEYLYMFCNFCINQIGTSELSIKSKGKVLRKQSTPLLLEMISWIIQQWQEDLNDKLKTLLIDTCIIFEENFGSHFLPGQYLLKMFGDVKDILGFYKRENSVSELVPVSRVKSSNRPLNRTTKDIEKAKQYFKDKQNRQLQREAVKIQPWEKAQKRIKQELDIRKTMLGRSRDTNIAVYKDGTVKPEIESIKLYEFDADEEMIPILLKKYIRALKVLFVSYSGTGFERKPGSISDFEWLRDRKNKLNEAEHIKMLTDYLLIPQLLTKEELKLILKSYCFRFLKQADQTYVDFEGFKGMFVQIAMYIYSKPGQDFSHLPPVVSVLNLFQFVRESFKFRGQSTEIFDEPDPGIADKHTVRALNAQLLENPEMAIPKHFTKIPDHDIKVSFELPSNIEIPESYRISYEILDLILDTGLGFHVIEPQVILQRFYRTKGIPTKKPVLNRPRVHERELKRPKLSPPPPARPRRKLSDFLGKCVSEYNEDEKPLVEQCAKVLEDVLQTVQLRMSKVMSRPPVRISEKVETIKERERILEEERNKNYELKRANRQKKLLVEIEKGKEARKEKLMELEVKKKELEEKERVKEEIKAVREKRAKEIRAQLLKEWNEKKLAK